MNNSTTSLMNMKSRRDRNLDDVIRRNSNLFRNIPKWANTRDFVIDTYSFICTIPASTIIHDFTHSSQRTPKMKYVPLPM